MARVPNRYKRLRKSVAKPLARAKRQISATSSKLFAKLTGEVTPKRLKSVKERYRRLGPWLDFAYLPLDTPQAFHAALAKRFAGKYRLGEPPALTAPATLLRLPRDQRRVQALMDKAAVFRGLLEKLPALAMPAADEVPGLSDEALGDADTFSVEFMAADDGAGQLSFSLDPVFQGFIDAVDRAQLRRWKHCEVCGRMFFALRFKPGSTKNTQACSLRCNRVRRMRAWREKQTQYKYSRYQAEEKKARQVKPQKEHRK